MDKNIFEIIYIIAVVSLLIRLFFSLAIFLRSTIKRKERKKRPPLTPPLSVIVAARNESKNLSSFLTKVLEQDYPEYEVIVVDDGSTDDTRTVLAQYQQKYDHLKVTWVPSNRMNRKGKKMALTIGIKSASYENLVFIDADCYPSSNMWLREMGHQMTDSTDFVLGYGAYDKQKSWINAIIRYDTLKIALRYAGYAKLGKVYMGVGRNLSYRKKIWTDNKGFAQFVNVASGDDDLFVNAYAKSKRTQICFSKSSKTLSVPEKTFKDWKLQKSRHITTSSFYPIWLRFLFVLESTNQVISPLLIIPLIIIDPTNIFVLGLSGLWLITKITEMLIIRRGSKLLGESGLVLRSFYFDNILPLIYIIFAVSGAKVAKDKLWK